MARESQSSDERTSLPSEDEEGEEETEDEEETDEEETEEEGEEETEEEETEEEETEEEGEEEGVQAVIPPQKVKSSAENSAVPPVGNHVESTAKKGDQREVSRKPKGFRSRNSFIGEKAEHFMGQKTGVFISGVFIGGVFISGVFISGCFRQWMLP